MVANQNARMRSLNSYFKDLIEGKVLQPLIIKRLKSGALNAHMASIGGLGGRTNCRA
ncbi:MAG: hypothetical protein HQ500_12295 [Flavobacteriales bacterium]|nr:hypothetical protein [Flavobacteriales bacterium]